MQPDDRGPWDETPRGLGIVVDAERGALPYTLIHGESLVACAAWGLGEAGVRLFDSSVAWSEVVESGEPLVLHDALCPMTPPEFIASCVQMALDEDAMVIGVRPVTDTVKVIDSGLVGATVDRDDLVALLSPIVLPARVVAALPDWPPPNLIDLVAGLAATQRVIRLEAPALARRVTSTDDLPLLEALTGS